MFCLLSPFGKGELCFRPLQTFLRVRLSACLLACLHLTELGGWSVGELQKIRELARNFGPGRVSGIGGRGALEILCVPILCHCVFLQGCRLSFLSFYFSSLPKGYGCGYLVKHSGIYAFSSTTNTTTAHMIVCSMHVSIFGSSLYDVFW